MSALIAKETRFERRSAVAALCKLNVVAIVFLQRIVVPLGGDAGVSCLLPLAALSIAFLFLSRCAVLDNMRLLACLLFISSAVLSQIFIPVEFSIGSLALLVAIYILIPFRILVSADKIAEILKFFVACMYVIALITAAQF